MSKTIKIKKNFKKDIDEALQEAPLEEHFIMRFPIHIANQLRDPIRNRQESIDLSFQWKDGRHGKLVYQSKQFNTTLVDLPCITESLKTIDNKQFYKVGNVSQMVIVEKDRYKGPKDYLWPDGIVYALKNVRSSRFRKRMSKRIIEDVEKEVERLLAADLEAEQVRYEVHDKRDQEGSIVDSEQEVDDDDEFDLEAAIDEAMDEKVLEEEEEEEEESESETESESNNESELSDHDETNELKIQEKVLKNEIQQLELKLNEKHILVANQVNAIMKERFKGIVSKLTMELTLKKEQLEKVMKEIVNQEDE